MAVLHDPRIRAAKDLRGLLLIGEQDLRALISQAEAEVSHRLRRQPDPKPQFVNGVRAGVRWYLEALRARLKAMGIDLDEEPPQ